MNYIRETYAYSRMQIGKRSILSFVRGSARLRACEAREWARSLQGKIQYLSRICIYLHNYANAVNGRGPVLVWHRYVLTSSKEINPEGDKTPWHMEGLREPRSCPLQTRTGICRVSEVVVLNGIQFEDARSIIIHVKFDGIDEFLVCKGSVYKYFIKDT